jgi:hypothetical protein
MLALWEAGTGPQRLSLHVVFSVDLTNLLQAASAFARLTSSHSILRASPPTSTI